MSVIITKNEIKKNFEKNETQIENNSEKEKQKMLKQYLIKKIHPKRSYNIKKKNKDQNRIRELNYRKMIKKMKKIEEIKKFNEKWKIKYLKMINDKKK